MRRLTDEELDRLVRSNRRLALGLTATVLLGVLAVVLIVATDVDFVVRGGVGLGAFIGALMVIPNRKVIADLGLTVDEAREILQAEKERRNGVADLTATERANRDELRGRIMIGVGLLLVVVLVVSAWYFFGKAGETVEEDAPLDPWFTASFIGMAVGLIAGIPLLVAGKNRRGSAADWRSVARDNPGL